MNEHDRIERELEKLGLEPKFRGRYWHIHCPFHDDSNKSAVCFTDGWIHCFAGCPRQHINKLSGCNICSYAGDTTQQQESKHCDFTDFWLDLDPVSTDVKGVPKAVLQKLGWRDFPELFGTPSGIMIPYFNTERTKVLFYQIRHNEGAERRFTFAKGCTPICYGLECLNKCEKYLCFTEGSRDSVILRMCGIPAIALPSASSAAILRNMEKYAKEHKLILVCVGDRDEAGDKLISNISGPFIDARTPVGKDVGDFYAEKGLQEVKKYYGKYSISRH